ncbi:XRE family transcriptional regulator [Mucilaginibacter terrenus]|jgi:transcriptional regulator with XRE-family HTH domain|uniref:XRE family transcriptional regulator n=1 Tax=Mucilaginibacter terrenus TaxID=2482727 RepID=A0A3E2NXN2_9SPHI|nr:helix-turn-helix transcriptional regulator [Mucilaginibacter terrenus]RFZ85747.1 XRE family transcriptional regulator [Mucilaginibacter terrenus]
MLNEKTLAAAIKTRRLQLNYTQEYIAYKLNMSQNAYSKMELGYTSITVSRLIELCRALETDLFDMLKPVMQVA